VPDVSKLATRRLFILRLLDFDRLGTLSRFALGKV
jgi:hypothetical protein